MPSRRPPVPLERDILKACLATLRVRWGLMVERQNTGAFRMGKRFIRCGTPGRADISGVMSTAHARARAGLPPRPDGRRIEIEIKRPGNKPTPAQLDYLRSINASGGVAFWVDDPRQIDAVMPDLIAGCRIVIDGNGDQFVVDETEE